MRILLISKSSVLSKPRRLTAWLDILSAHQLMVLQESYLERYAPHDMLRIDAESATKSGVEMVVQFGKLDDRVRPVAEALRAAGVQFNLER